MQIKKTSKFAAVLSAVLCSLTLMGAPEYPAEGTLELQYPLPEAQIAKFGSIPANRFLATNTWDIVEALRTNILYKQDRFLFGKGFNMDATYYKLTLAATSDVDHVAPPHQFVYVSDLNSSASVYGPNMLRMTPWDDVRHVGWDITEADVAAGEQPKLRTVNSNGNIDTWAFESEPIQGLIVSLDPEQPTTYGWSHPGDWRVMWMAGEDVDPGTGTEHTDHVGEATIRSDYTYTATKNSTAYLYVDYLDEVNIPSLGSITWEIIDGNATISGDRLVAAATGVVTVRARAENGTERTGSVSMYTYKSSKTNEGIYQADNPAGRCYAARNRVNNFYLQTLQQHRADPDTSYHYICDGNNNYANPGDKFTGEWGELFNPYQFVGVNSSGNNSYWWSHPAVSKHVLVGAAHYGDYNHNRFIGGYEYFNFDRRHSGRTQVKVTKWYYLRDWAKDHGFEGDDANVGDISCWVIDGEVPDECLPYIASVDWLNQTYGCNVDAVKGKFVSNNMPCVTFHQTNIVSLRSADGVTWNQHYMTGPAGTADWANSGSDNHQYANRSRADVCEYASKGCWHSVRVGDSGHPTFFFDPALTGTYGSTQFMRPILLTTDTTGLAGASYPRVTKVLRAFCKWVAEQKGTTLEADMPYTLGDVDGQTTNTAEIEANAVRFMTEK